MTDLNKNFVNNVERMDIEVIGGEGAKLHLADGRTMYDLWGDEGVASLGYGTRFNEALDRFKALNHPHRLPEVYPNKIRSRAADMLCERHAFPKVFFCNSGAEVNEAAIKLARRYQAKVVGEPERNIIVTVEGNFHGRSGFALAASDSTDSPYHKEGYQPLATGFGVITEDELITGENPRVNLAPFTADGTNKGTDQIPWHRVAALHFAPVLGNNVVRTYSPAFWAAVERLRAEKRVLISYDEVQVANGRTGYFAGWQHPSIGVKPDLCGIGKGLALGLPCAALFLTEEVAKAFTPGVHFSTFGGTILVMHMVTELMEYLDWNLPRIRRVGAFAEGMFRGRSWIKNFDGLGLHWGFTPGYLDHDGFVFCKNIQKRGVLMITHRKTGPIRWTPPLVVTEDDVKAIFHAMDLAAAETALSPKGD